VLDVLGILSQTPDGPFVCVPAVLLRAMTLVQWLCCCVLRFPDTTPIQRDPNTKDCVEHCVTEPRADFTLRRCTHPAASGVIGARKFAASSQIPLGRASCLASDPVLPCSESAVHGFNSLGHLPNLCQG
jgi:hypothetical protein